MHQTVLRPVNHQTNKNNYKWDLHNGHIRVRLIKTLVVLYHIRMVLLFNIVNRGMVFLGGMFEPVLFNMVLHGVMVYGAILKKLFNSISHGESVTYLSTVWWV